MEQLTDERLDLRADVDDNIKKRLQLENKLRKLFGVGPDDERLEVLNNIDVSVQTDGRLPPCSL